MYVKIVCEKLKKERVRMRKYISIGAVEAIAAAGRGRTEKEIEASKSAIFNLILQEYKEIQNIKEVGATREILVVGRRMGKTSAIIEFAERYNIPIIATWRNDGLLKQIAKKANRNVKIIRIGTDITDISNGTIKILLKDEGTKVKEIRESIPWYVNVIGITSIDNI